MNSVFSNSTDLPAELADILNSGVEIIVPESRERLLELAMGGPGNATFDVKYRMPDGSEAREAYVTRCKNGIVANYYDLNMRRRDPDSMVIADKLPTDKPTHMERFGCDFEGIRLATFEWLKEQPALIAMPFLAGNDKAGTGYHSMLIIPANAAFFALGLADLQGFIPLAQIEKLAADFSPLAVVYVAPPFRNMYYGGRQVVIHNRIHGGGRELHEVFSYNLYPGPSAKKGIYGVLLNIGERERWVTLHASTVNIITPYELSVTIMHEGASGGGKSEMLESFHREQDGHLLLGRNVISGEKYIISMTDTSTLNPVSDDMALAHPSLQGDDSRLVVADAENGWFLRVDHITHYGTDPETERNTIHPKKPLLFLNLQGQPDSTCLIWEPIMDSPGKPCSNPRVIMPREFVSNVVEGAVPVDIRSFGIRTPPATHQHPSYGIVGIFHVLNPALAWIWRLVSPRGYANPSILDSALMSSEGVGSYWPFATGKMVDQANLLLDQILRTLSTRYVLIPNQHVGAYHVGFSAQWLTREYLSRRGGAKFRPEALTPARCPLLGYALNSMKIDGAEISRGFLQVNLQPEVGDEGYDAGAKILMDFFKEELRKFLTPQLLPLGRKIIETCLNDGSVADYYDLIPKL